MKGSGLAIVAVNGFEPADIIRRYRKAGKFTFPLLINGKGKDDMAARYRVAFFPTNYLLDSRGRIVARYVGFDDKSETDLKAKLRQLGLHPR